LPAAARLVRELILPRAQKAPGEHAVKHMVELLQVNVKSRPRSVAGDPCSFVPVGIRE
jgi:hypothetical protein